MMLSSRSVAFALLSSLTGAAAVGDLVKELPGWKGPTFSATYSGYISAGHEDGHTMIEHYMFFESEGNPQTDPVLLWTNGGPGAASLFGAFTELGPYYLSDASMQTEDFRATGVPSLFENPFRWTTLGSLLVINSPPPVGFSYCEPAGPSGSGTSCGSWNDTKTARHNLEFLKNWRSAFPEFSTQDLYLIGESYAGIYVPTLARAILEDGPSGLAEQLKGFAVGDGCLGGDNDSGACVPWGGKRFTVDFFYGHGQFSTKTYQAIQENCPADELLNGPIKTPGCKAALAKMDQERGYSFDYNLYDECYDFDLGNARRSALGAPQQVASKSSYEAHHIDGAPCGGGKVLAVWVNHSAVRRGLHVAENSFFFAADNGIGFVYNTTEPSLVPFYKHVAENTKLRVLIYNGDADPSLNTFLGQYWTSSVGLLERESWRPWTLDGERHMGGFVTRYEGDFDFLTIRGAGHMVPQFKPAAALAFLKTWLANESFPALGPQYQTKVEKAASPAAEELIV